MFCDFGIEYYPCPQKWPQCMMCGITLPNMRVASEGQIQTCPGAKCVSKARGGMLPSVYSRSKGT